MPCGGRGCWRNLLQSLQSMNWDSERERNALRACCFSYSWHYWQPTHSGHNFPCTTHDSVATLRPYRRQHSTSKHMAPAITRTRLWGFPPFQTSLTLPCSADVPSLPSTKITTPVKEAWCQIAAASPWVTLGISVLLSSLLMCPYPTTSNGAFLEAKTALKVFFTCELRAFFASYRFYS